MARKGAGRADDGQQEAVGGARGRRGSEGNWAGPPLLGGLCRTRKRHLPASAIRRAIIPDRRADKNDRARASEPRVKALSTAVRVTSSMFQ